MDFWLENVVRQIIFYSLPVLISLTSVSMLESRISGKAAPHPFHAIGWIGTWLPWIGSILFSRALIIALPQPIAPGLKPALIRAASHLAICLTGFALFSLSLDHQPPTGLPPLHFWWAKVLMYFNLCMVGINLLPVAGQILGEVALPHLPVQLSEVVSKPRSSAIIVAFLAVTPLLDLTIGAIVVFPIYERLVSLA